MLSPIASRGRRLGRTVALTVPLLLLPVPFAPAATAASKPELPIGLFGEQDPTFDGVYRQSLALLAYAAEDAEPPAEAIAWLLDQQCDNGGFVAFRADTSKPCADANPDAFSGPDTNATAMAVQALGVWDETEAADAALGYLESAQNADGGIPSIKGGASDANSTGLTAMAVSASGANPDEATSSSGKSLTDALDALQVGCSGDADEQGAYAFTASDPLVANDYATVQALMGRSGAWLPFVTEKAAAGDSPRLDCGSGGTTDAATAAAGYLAQRLSDNDGTIPDAFNPGGTDWGSTRFAVMALAAAGNGRNALIEAFTQLSQNQDKYLEDDQGRDRPAALSELILATYAAQPSIEAGVDQLSVSRQTVVLGVNTAALIDRLEATLNAAPEQPTPEPSPEAESGSGVPSTDATNGGTEIADTGATTTDAAVAALAMLALGGVLVAASRHRWSDAA
jgi:hypothetical protein